MLRSTPAYSLPFAIIVALFFVIFTPSAHAATNVYYSVGQSSSNLMTGSPTVTISSGMGSFSTAQTGNIGVGDKVTYNTSAVAYISGKVSQTRWSLVTATGTTPTDIASSTVVSIKRAFMSLSSAVSGISGVSYLATSSLVSANVIVNIPCYYDSGPDTTSVGIASSTITGPSNYINIYTPNNTSTQANFSQRDNGTWSSNAYQLTTTNAGYGIDVKASYVRIMGLQIDMVQTATSTGNTTAIRLMNNTSGVVTSSTSEIVIDSNIIRAQIASTPTQDVGIGNYGYGATPTVAILNNVIYDFAAGTSTSYGVDIAGGVYYIYDNTVYNTYGAFNPQTSNTTVLYKNNIAQNDMVGYVASAAIVGPSSTNNISDHADAPDYPQDPITVNFGSTSTRDLRLAPFNPFVIGQGANLTADPNYPFTYDIQGQTRPPSGAWDVGAAQYTGATYSYSPPTVASFAMPTNASSVIVPVISLVTTSTANSAVAYLITESATPPSSTNPNWLLSVPKSFIFGGSGTRTAYAYTMDAYGDVSPSANATVTITPSFVPVSSSSSLPAGFFSMDLNDSNWPTVSFGGLRLWDDDTSWMNIETASGTYVWTHLDNFLIQAEASGTDVLYVFGAVPGWASSNPGQVCGYGYGCAAPPSDIGSGDNIWKSFVTQLVEHSLASPTAHIKYYELWNEPNNSATWTGTATQMATMAGDAYTIIHSLDPSAIVLSPSISSPNGLSWLSSYYAAGGSAYQDATAFHTYSIGSDPSQVMLYVNNLRSLMSQYGIGNEALYATEGSWGYNTTLNLEQQAAFLAQEYLYLWQQNVARYYWYAWDNSSWGMLWNASSGINEAGTAYGILGNWLIGSVSQSSPCSETADFTWTCDLTLANGEPAEVLWNPYTTATKTVSAALTTYQTLANNNSNSIVGNVVSVGNEPILLVSTDSVAPVITSFNMPSTATSTSVAVSSFSATDSQSTITGYLITESSSTPSLTSSNWSATPPTSFEFSDSGNQTAYAWVKDAAGNIPSAISANVVITLPVVIVASGGGGGGSYAPPTATSAATSTSSNSIPTTTSTLPALSSRPKSTEALQSMLLSLEAELNDLLQQASARGITVPGVTSPSTATITRNLTIGSRGTDVAALQHYLNTHGFPVVATATYAGSLGFETQYFGVSTQTALARFQKSAGITPAVGYLGSITRAYVKAHP